MGYYIYKGESAETNKLINDLYYDMGTNSNLAGTSVSQFKSGFEKYIYQKKRSNFCENGIPKKCALCEHDWRIFIIIL